MKKLSLPELMKEIPKNAKTGVFIMTPLDNAGRFQKATFRAIRNGIPNGMRVAVLIFGKGIADFRSKQIAHEIGNAIKQDSTLNEKHPKIRFHVHTFSNISKSEIRRLTSKYARKGILRVFHDY